MDSVLLEFDFGTLAGQRWWAENIVAPLAALLPIGGIYLDGVSGGWARLSYPPVVDLSTHLQHGGFYCVQGKREVFQRCRDAVAAAGVDDPCEPAGNPDAFVASESVEEFIYHDLHMAQEGYVFVPGLMQFAVVRLNPAAPVAASEQPAPPAKETPPLNPAGSKSIAGAPSSGSTPVIPDNRPVPSIEESLKRALAKARAA